MISVIPESVVSLYVVQSVGEDLQESVECAPGLLSEHLRQELVEETFDTQRLHLREDEQSTVGLHYAGTQSCGNLVIHLDTKQFTEESSDDDDDETEENTDDDDDNNDNDDWVNCANKNKKSVQIPQP